MTDILQRLGYGTHCRSCSQPIGEHHTEKCRHFGQVVPSETYRHGLPRFYNIDDAPFYIGQKVKVALTVDETAESADLGKIGVVEYYEYDCGCGQSYPRDPMIGILFEDGTRGEFWKEELRDVGDCRNPIDGKECDDRGLTFDQLCPECQDYWRRASELTGKSAEEALVEIRKWGVA